MFNCCRNKRVYKVSIRGFPYKVSNRGFPYKVSIRIFPFQRDMKSVTNELGVTQTIQNKVGVSILSNVQNSRIYLPQKFTPKWKLKKKRSNDQKRKFPRRPISPGRIEEGQILCCTMWKYLINVAFWHYSISLYVNVLQFSTIEYFVLSPPSQHNTEVWFGNNTLSTNTFFSNQLS